MKQILLLIILSFSQTFASNHFKDLIRTHSNRSSIIEKNNTAYGFEGIKKINGIDIYCKVIGRGEPLVIVHGGPGLGYEYLAPHFEILAKDFQLIFYDQRGCGRSTEIKPGESLSIDQLVEDLEGIRKEFKIDKLNLIGQSFGARVAISYTIKFPNSVKKLILLEPMYGSSEYLPQFQKILMDRLPVSVKNELGKLAQSEELKNYELNAVKKLVKMRLQYYYFDSTKVNKNYLDYFDSEKAKKFMMSQAALTKEQLNFNLYDQMKNIMIPTLIIRGDYDPIPIEAIERINKAIPNSILHVVKNCGHFVHIEKPEEYFPQIKDFMETE